MRVSFIGSGAVTEFSIYNSQDLPAVLAAIAKLDLDKPWRVEIEPWRKKRSGRQNAYYWKCLEIIANETGDDKDSLHTYFRRKFLSPVEKAVMGQTTLCLRSTTDLNTAEFAEYMDRIIAEVGPFGIAIPSPEEMAA